MGLWGGLSSTHRILVQILSITVLWQSNFLKADAFFLHFKEKWSQGSEYSGSEDKISRMFSHKFKTSPPLSWWHHCRAVKYCAETRPAKQSNIFKSVHLNRKICKTLKVGKIWNILKFKWSLYDNVCQGSGCVTCPIICLFFYLLLFSFNVKLFSISHDFRRYGNSNRQENL